MAYTLGQAAKAVGKSKATIQVAIKKGRIAATQDEKGVYQIEANELFRVYPPERLTDRAKTEQKTAAEHSENSTLEARLKVLEEIIADLRADKDRAAEREAAATRREEDLRRDLDQWRGFAFDAQQRLKALEAPKPPEERGKIIEASAEEVPPPDPVPSPPPLGEEEPKKKRGGLFWFWPWSILAA